MSEKALDTFQIFRARSPPNQLELSKKFKSEEKECTETSEEKAVSGASAVHQVNKHVSAFLRCEKIRTGHRVFRFS